MNDKQTLKLNILKDIYGTDSWLPEKQYIKAKKKEVFVLHHRYVRDSIPTFGVVVLRIRRKLRKLTSRMAGPRHRVRRATAMGRRPVKPVKAVMYSRLGGGR